MYQEISRSLKELIEGRAHGLRELLRGIRPKTVLLAPSKTSVSIEEAVILLNKFNFLVDTDLDLIHREAINLLNSWGIADVMSLRCHSTCPARRLILFLIGWQGVNLSRCLKLKLKEVLQYLKSLARSITSESLALVLIALGIDEIGRDIVKRGGGEADLRNLVEFTLYPLLGGSFSSTLPRARRLVWEEISSKMVRVSEEIEVKLPRGRLDEKFLDLVVRLAESYREIAQIVKKILSKLSYMKLGLEDDLRELKEVTSQLSCELDDWSLSRRIRLIGAKVLRRKLNFLALYHHITDEVLNEFESIELIERLSRNKSPSASPMPFGMRGFSYLELS